MSGSSSLCLQNLERMQSATARRVPSLRQLSSLPDPSNPPKLKKLINQLVQELTFLGFGPEVVRELVQRGDDVLRAMGGEHSPDAQTAAVFGSHTTTSSGLRLLYEVDNDLGHLAPQLRFIIDKDTDMDTTVSDAHAATTRILTRDVKPFVPISASPENSSADS